MKKVTAFLILFYASLAFADPPVLEIPAELKPAGQYVKCLPKTDAVNVAFVGLDGIEPIPSDLLKDTRLFLLDTRGLAVGRYRFAAVGAGKTGEQTRTDFAVIIGTPPKPPEPPGPGPDPDPFQSKVDPFHAVPPGFRCLIVYEANDIGKYPDAQRQIMYSDSVRSYLRSHCIKASDGVPDWRVLDKDADMTNEDEMWQKVMKLDRKSLPWIYLGNGKNGYNGPLPADVDAAMALLKKFGGN